MLIDLLQYILIDSELNFFYHSRFLINLRSEQGGGGGGAPHPRPAKRPRFAKFATYIFAVFKVTNLLFTLLIPYLPSEFASHIEIIFLICHSITHLNLIAN